MDCFYLIEDYFDAFSFENRMFQEEYFTLKERYHFETLHSLKRKGEWTWGRIVAKKLIKRYFSNFKDSNLSYKDIEVENDNQGKPFFSLKNCEGAWVKSPFHLSISHRKGRVCAALCPTNECIGLGIDCEWIESRPELFAETFFTEAECHYLGRFTDVEQDIAITTLWSMKEAVLKAMGRGLTIDTNSILLNLESLPGKEWSSCSLDQHGHDTFPKCVWTICQNNYIISISIRTAETNCDTQTVTIHHLSELFEEARSSEGRGFNIIHAQHV